MSESAVIPHPKGIVVEREYRGHGVYWVHLWGPNTSEFLQHGGYFADAAARKWAGELGMAAGDWISGGGSWNGTKGGGNWARVSNSFAFREADK